MQKSLKGREKEKVKITKSLEEDEWKMKRERGG